MYRGTRYKFPENDMKIEFESLVYYKNINKLILISKDQRSRAADISAYSFDPGNQTYSTPRFFQYSKTRDLSKAAELFQMTKLIDCSD